MAVNFLILMHKNLSAADLEQFLDLLDPNRGQAAEKYIALRTRLEMFFEWRDCENTEGLTDIVFDRVIKKIIQGEKIRNAEAYCVSIAKFVLLESRRERLRTSEFDENSIGIIANIPAKDSIKEKGTRDQQLNCLEKCLAKLSADKRKLLTDYFNTDEKNFITTRKCLASGLGITLNTLRIRVCRLKSILEKCTKDCCQEC